MDRAGHRNHSRDWPIAPVNPANVGVRALAGRDIEDHYRWLSKEAGVDMADRFLTATDKAFWMLAEHPGMGPAVASANERIARLRKWKIDGFPSAIIFYEPRANGITIVRVIHAAQDWWRLIGA